MAYLFQIILILLTISILLSPISLSLSFYKSFKLTVSLYFWDLTLSPDRRKKKKIKKIKKRLKSFVRSLTAYKRSLDTLLKRSRTTLYDNGQNSNSETNPPSAPRSLLFSVFLSYLASKSGILITDRINTDAKDYNAYSSALIETRTYRIFAALIKFLIVRFFPKKEQ